MRLLTGRARPTKPPPLLVPRPAGQFAPPATPLLDLTVHAAETGTAILETTRVNDAMTVVAIHRLAAGLDPAAAWLRERFPDLPTIGDAHVIIDADGLGRALWDKLELRLRRGWTLYEARGRDRQALVNALLVAVSDRRVHVAPSSHGDALRRAMASYRRTVGDDGIIGGELVVALALAALVRRPTPPRVY